MIEEVNKTHTCTHSLNRYFVVIKAADDEIGLQAISRGGNVKSRSHHLLLRGVLLAVCNSSLSKGQRQHCTLVQEAPLCS